MGDRMIELARHALGRPASDAAPSPPEVDEPVARLVHIDVGLPELFAARAAANGMGVQFARVDEILQRMAAILRKLGCRTVAVAEARFLESLNVLDALRSEGFDARRSAEVELDQMHEIDCGLTDVSLAVAEVGGMVMRPAEKHQQGVWLLPRVHVAVIEPARLVGDLLDLFGRLATERTPNPMTIVTGPSRPAESGAAGDKGRQGPNLVQAFMLQ